MTPALLVSSVLALVVAHLAIESVRHTRRLRRIPIRIHVNGTRGKSSVTRQIAAALRGAGLRTLAKVTGDEPRLILPDGREEVIVRRGPARIHEQLWFVRRAAELGAEAIVVECMALAPELQQISEERMLRATIGVITNVRPDHFEIMGETLDDVAAALARTIPTRGVLITADRRYRDPYTTRASAKGTTVVFAEPIATSPATAPRPADEHAAIVRAVGAHLGLGARGPGVSDFLPPATPAVRPRTLGGRTVHFLDAFSANDPTSTELLLAACPTATALPRPWVALLNNRADRPRRMQAFLPLLRDRARFDAVALGGDLGGLARRQLGRGDTAWMLESDRPEAVLEEIGRRLHAREYSLFGLGNSKGLGLALARLFQEKGN